MGLNFQLVWSVKFCFFQFSFLYFVFFTSYLHLKVVCLQALSGELIQLLSYIFLKEYMIEEPLALLSLDDTY